jgi:hypothetical protein
VVVVGYIAVFIAASNGGTRHPFSDLLIGILSGVIYLVLRYFEIELPGRFSPSRRRSADRPVCLRWAKRAFCMLRMRTIGKARIQT